MTRTGRSSPGARSASVSAWFGSPTAISAARERRHEPRAVAVAAERAAQLRRRRATQAAATPADPAREERHRPRAGDAGERADGREREHAVEQPARRAPGRRGAASSRSGRARRRPSRARSSRRTGRRSPAARRRPGAGRTRPRRARRTPARPPRRRRAQLVRAVSSSRPGRPLVRREQRDDGRPDPEQRELDAQHHRGDDARRRARPLGREQPRRDEPEQEPQRQGRDLRRDERQRVGHHRRAPADGRLASADGPQAAWHGRAPRRPPPIGSGVMPGAGPCRRS